MQKQMLQESTKQMILETEWPIIRLDPGEYMLKEINKVKEGRTKNWKKGEAANLE